MHFIAVCAAAAADAQYTDDDDDDDDYEVNMLDKKCGCTTTV